jgi:hypothetical protein
MECSNQLSRKRQQIIGNAARNNQECSNKTYIGNRHLSIGKTAIFVLKRSNKI